MPYVSRGRVFVLKRDIWEQLTAWKERKHHPLVLKGLRQTGKTFIVKQFGNEKYANTVYLDLRANKQVHNAFAGDFNVDMMVMAISAAEPGARFIPNSTLIILDEIQDCPNARSSLKYWDLDGRYDVIATGSFLGVKGFREPYNRGIPVGYEEQMTLFPLSFHEFLINSGINEDVLDYVDMSLKNHQTVEKTIHEAMRSLYFQYLVVGGMPEADKAFFETHDLNEVRMIQRRILSSIRDDFGRYRDSNGNDKVNEVLKLRAEACLDSLPAQLSKEYKKFKYSLVDAKGHSTDKADGLQYLEDVGLVMRAYNTKQISFPLEAEKIHDEFKVFYVDTGLLISQLGNEVLTQILSGNISAYKGAIAENMVASAFAVHDWPLYYFHAPSGSPELDFLFENQGQVVITECKSTNGRATSMKFVLAHPQKYGNHKAVKFADTNVGEGDGYATYPLYTLGFLKNEQIQRTVQIMDYSKITVPGK